MQAFEHFTGIVAPLPMANVDTDQIIPKQYLKSIRRTGFGENLFDDWRYLVSGEPGQPVSERPVNPEFVLNKPEYQGASILLTQANFGCGSSREHAPWALQQFGFRCLIAPSFADIFYNNSFKNGVLCVTLPEAQIEQLFALEAASEPHLQLSVDLERQVLLGPGDQQWSFEIDLFRKTSLLEGLDDIGMSLQAADQIRDYEQRRQQQAPWLFADMES